LDLTTNLIGEKMRILTTAGAMVAAALLAFTPTSPVSAADGGSPASLTLSWSAPTVSNQVSTATLNCLPASGGGGYMDIEAACADAAAANGDLTALRGWPFVSCAGYRGWPIRTTATGTWLGRSVTYDVVHANVCEARKATGWLFAF
jgi:hypothetical protein